jgi:hypothetical protein
MCCDRAEKTMPVEEFLRPRDRESRIDRRIEMPGQPTWQRALRQTSWTLHSP